MANPSEPASVDGDAAGEDQIPSLSSRIQIRLLGIAALGLLLLTYDPIAHLKRHLWVAVPLVICVVCIGSAIARPNKASAILAVGALLLWLMLSFALP